jgi:hypothetical protein
MKIEPGKFYRTRDGRKVGPISPTNSSGPYKFRGRVDDGSSLFTEDGLWFTGQYDGRLDLIAEWTDPAPEPAKVGLTAITTPFGLLDAETQEALRAHGGPWEYWSGHRWMAPDERPGWFPELAYRVKPSPPKPREWWIYAGDLYSSRHAAINEPGANPDNIIHVREVTE